MARMFWLPTECCVQPSAIHAGQRLVGRRGGGEQLAHRQELVPRRAADLLHHLRRIAIDVLLQQIDDAARMLQRWIDLGEAVVTELVVPARCIVVVLLPRRSR